MGQFFLLLTAALSIGLTCLGFCPQVANKGLPGSVVGGGGPPGGNVTAIAIDPHDTAVIYVGTGSGGIFKSTDKGETWSPANSGITDDRIYALTMNPLDDSNIFAGTGDGIFKSADGGENWIPVSINMRPWGSKLFLVPSKPPTVYTSSGFVFKSDNGGGSWNEVNSVQRETYIDLLAIDPINPTTVYGGISRPPDVIVLDGWHANGLYRSVDGGKSWSQIASFLPRALAICGKPPAIYAATAEGLLISNDNGTTWRKSNTGLPNGGVRNLAIDPRNPALLYAITENPSVLPRLHDDLSRIYKSSDGGNSWTKISTFPATVLTVDPSDSATLYAGTGTGIMKSTDGGESWSPSNSGLAGASVGILGISSGSPSTVYAVAAGIFRSTDRGHHWKFGTASANHWINTLATAPSDPSIAYAAGIGGILKTTDQGKSWAPVAWPFANEWVLSLAVDPSDPSTVYAGTRGLVHKSTDGGKSWERRISELKTGRSDTVIALIIEPSDTNTLYAGMGEGEVFKSTDAGKSWTQLNSDSIIATYPHRGAQVIVQDPRDPSILYAGATDCGVYRSVDGGRYWKQTNSGLGNISVEALAIDPSHPATIYAGTTRHGAFRSTNRGDTWTPINSGLPRNIWVTALAIDSSKPKTIYAGTEGAGVFKSTNGGGTWQPTSPR